MLTQTPFWVFCYSSVGFFTISRHTQVKNPLHFFKPKSKRKKKIFDKRSFTEHHIINFLHDGRTPPSLIESFAIPLDFTLDEESFIVEVDRSLKSEWAEENRINWKFC